MIVENVVLKIQVYLDIELVLTVIIILIVKFLQVILR